MGTTQSAPATALPENQENKDTPVATPEADAKPKKKMCCACPDTKKLRDECIAKDGEAACSKLIEAHLTCLRAEGFNV